MGGKTSGLNLEKRRHQDGSRVASYYIACTCSRFQWRQGDITDLHGTRTQLLEATAVRTSACLGKNGRTTRRTQRLLGPFPVSLSLGLLVGVNHRRFEGLKVHPQSACLSIGLVEEAPRHFRPSDDRISPNYHLDNLLRWDVSSSQFPDEFCKPQTEKSLNSKVQKVYFP